MDPSKKQRRTCRASSQYIASLMSAGTPPHPQAVSIVYAHVALQPHAVVLRVRAQRAITKVAHHASNVRVGRWVGKQAGPRQVGGNCAWQDAVAEQEERRRKAIAHFERALRQDHLPHPGRPCPLDIIPKQRNCCVPPCPRARNMRVSGKKVSPENLLVGEPVKFSSPSLAAVTEVVML